MEDEGPIPIPVPKPDTPTDQPVESSDVVLTDTNAAPAAVAVGPSGPKLILLILGLLLLFSWLKKR